MGKVEGLTGALLGRGRLGTGILGPRLVALKAFEKSCQDVSALTLGQSRRGMWFEVCEVRQSIEDDPEYTRNDRKYVKLLHPPLEIHGFRVVGALINRIGFWGIRN